MIRTGRFETQISGEESVYQDFGDGRLRPIHVNPDSGLARVGLHEPEERFGDGRESNIDDRVVRGRLNDLVHVRFGGVQADVGVVLVALVDKFNVAIDKLA